jgi:hypothetical protein
MLQECAELLLSVGIIQPLDLPAADSQSLAAGSSQEACGKSGGDAAAKLRSSESLSQAAADLVSRVIVDTRVCTLLPDFYYAASGGAGHAHTVVETNVNAADASAAAVLPPSPPAPPVTPVQLRPLHRARVADSISAFACDDAEATVGVAGVDNSHDHFTFRAKPEDVAIGAAYFQAQAAALAQRSALNHGPRSPTTKQHLPPSQPPTLSPHQPSSIASKPPPLGALDGGAHRAALLAVLAHLGSYGGVPETGSGSGDGGDAVAVATGAGVSGSRDRPRSIDLTGGQGRPSARAGLSLAHCGSSAATATAAVPASASLSPPARLPPSAVIVAFDDVPNALRASRAAQTRTGIAGGMPAAPSSSTAAASNSSGGGSVFFPHSPTNRQSEVSLEVSLPATVYPQNQSPPAITAGMPLQTASPGAPAAAVRLVASTQHPGRTRLMLVDSADGGIAIVPAPLELQEDASKRVRAASGGADSALLLSDRSRTVSGNAESAAQRASAWQRLAPGAAWEGLLFDIG